MHVHLIHKEQRYCSRSLFKKQKQKQKKSNNNKRDTKESMIGAAEYYQGDIQLKLHLEPKSQIQYRIWKFHNSHS